MIQVSHLTKVYGDHIAAKDVTFSIDKGCICGFLGPNGAGKSTTMNMITGYLAPNSGTVEINGVSMQKEPIKAKKMIGYLPEIPPIYPDMTVLEFLSFAAELKGILKFQRADEVNRVIEKAGLEGVKTRVIKYLSKGYKQRVGLAQALIGDPEILILDEPTVGLDPKQIVEIRDLIRELKENHTVILSSHILSEIEAVCDRIIVISHGRVVASAEPDQLVKENNEVQTFTLVVKGNASSAENALSGIEDINTYKIESEQDGQVKLRVMAKRHADIRESVSVKCQEAGLTILELNVSYVSLEDVYLKLTSESYYKELLQKEGITPDDDELEEEDGE
ncbi:MAG: ABC transporter ATP-binding protein [Lachnospiraceae bacterium]|nr:ABC transporter ATP-binding protein [Lachnospiraceae bacterium]